MNGRKVVQHEIDELAQLAQFGARDGPDRRRTQYENVDENQATSELTMGPAAIGHGNRLISPARELEIELAMSALPPQLREQATIYVLNPAEGFEIARKGTNGFHAFVARTGDDTFHGS